MKKVCPVRPEDCPILTNDQTRSLVFVSIRAINCVELRYAPVRGPFFLAACGFFQATCGDTKYCRPFPYPPSPSLRILSKKKAPLPECFSSLNLHLCCGRRRQVSLNVHFVLPSWRMMRPARRHVYTFRPPSPWPDRTWRWTPKCPVR
jgi:hypothetical protein